MNDSRPYSGLMPAVVLQAVEQAGYTCDGSLLSLNSYENRVYRVGVEGGQPVVAKFYRPDRWSDEAILEEHAFSIELQSMEIPVIAPLIVNGQSLLQNAGYRFAVYPLCGGRWPELSNADDRRMLGRFLARIHAVGRLRQFDARPDIDVDRLGKDSVEWLLESDFIPAHLEDAYDSLTGDLLPAIDRCFDLAGDFRWLRIHGDCHLGNILWTGNGPHFVDLDDCVNGPAVQDIWMLLSGGDDEMRLQLSEILEGYEEFLDFNPRELWLVEALRTLRLMHYSAWIARRWDDPAFPKAFPWFEGTRYWEDHILALREQAALLQERPLSL
jgi:Ser/Thr protein kinase RdoA (MazF antagonist)